MSVRMYGWVVLCLVMFAGCQKHAPERQTEELIEKLQSEKGESAMLALIEQLERRKDPAAIPALSRVLKEAELKVASAALMALVAIGDERAAPAVIEYAERKPANVRLQAIYAVRVLGGKTAAGWLFALSTGYDNEQVQRAAKAALLDVEARLQQSAKEGV